MTRRPRITGRRILAVYTALLLLFLYLPIAVIVLYSFSEAKINKWPIETYTLDWYHELRADREIISAVKLSFQVGIIASLLAVLLGTLGAFALDRYRFPGKPGLRFLVVLPITLPGIVTAVALLSYFTLIHWDLSTRTLVIGHATFCITLVLNNVVGRLSQLPRHPDEASADLGATPWQTFRRITFPLIRPAILAGAILAFTLSFDEIVVSFFLKGRENTLPLLIWGRLRRGLSPEINAVATLITAGSFVLVVLSTLLTRRGSGRA